MGNLDNDSLSAPRRHDLLSLVMGEARGKLEAQAAEYVTDDNVLRRAPLPWAVDFRCCFACSLIWSAGPGVMRPASCMSAAGPWLPACFFSPCTILSGKLTESEGGQADALGGSHKKKRCL